MENRSHALIAGVFALLLGLSAIYALWWFGGRHEASKVYLVVTTKNVSGLNSQAQVRYRGIRVGRVEQIALDANDSRNILIRIRIREEIPITEGTVARLATQGVTGIAHVQLDDMGNAPGRLVRHDGELPRIPMRDSMLQEITDMGTETLRTVRELVAGINQILNQENRQTISRTLANLETTTGNAREASAQLRQLLSPENMRLMHSLLLSAEQATGQTAPFLAEARGLVSRLQSVSDKLDVALGDPATGGGAALVPRLNELGSELVTTSRQLNRVLQMVEDSPQSLIFGHQKNLPGPGESGFVELKEPKRQP